MGVCGGNYGRGRLACDGGDRVRGCGVEGASVPKFHAERGGGAELGLLQRSAVSGEAGEGVERGSAGDMQVLQGTL